MFLSGKGIKDFTIENHHESPLKLHSSLFSCLELNHLELYTCLFHPIHIFHGFPNLLSLDLYNVSFESYDLGEFLTQCPLLEILKISINTDTDTICKMKEAEIEKLENLKVICSPNLQSLEILATYNDEVQPSVVSFPKVDYNRIGQLQLQKVNLQSFRGLEIEICLIKRLLCVSLMLKEMTITCGLSEMFGGESGWMMFATKLLRFLHASPTVEVFLLSGGAMFWASKKQTCITGSTMEYEFVALAAGGKEVDWLRNLILEIQLRSKLIAPIYIHGDNDDTLAKAYSEMYNEMSRHLGVRYNMIRELIINGVISIEFVRS
ncbi:zinc finger, CCHC-type containing protein [Tanacetum coccineum]